MIKPSVAETAAFKDLTPAQQKAYLKAHPKSKFGPNTRKVSAAGKHNSKIRKDAVLASRHGRRALTHAKKALAAHKAGNTKLVENHTALMNKHGLLFDTHSDKAKSTHFSNTTHKLSKKNSARFALHRKLGTAINSHADRIGGLTKDQKISRNFLGNKYGKSLTN